MTQIDRPIWPSDALVLPLPLTLCSMMLTCPLPGMPPEPEPSTLPLFDRGRALQRNRLGYAPKCWARIPFGRSRYPTQQISNPNTTQT